LLRWLDDREFARLSWPSRVAESVLAESVWGDSVRGDSELADSNGRAAAGSALRFVDVFLSALPITVAMVALLLCELRNQPLEFAGGL
jgi:hypothetical protein